MNMQLNTWINYRENEYVPGKESLKKLESLSMPLPFSPTSPEEVLEILNTVGSINTVVSNGARYFGFVLGGTLPAALAANWMAAAWDQCATFKVSSPVSAQLEKIARTWLLDLLQLPAQSAVGFVTGTTMANFCGVLAARHNIYKRKGWNSKTKGINGAPPIRVVVGEEIHASMLRALVLRGLDLRTCKECRLMMKEGSLQKKCRHWMNQPWFVYRPVM